jgi:hypothetical protein
MNEADFTDFRFSPCVKLPVKPRITPHHLTEERLAMYL